MFEGVFGFLSSASGPIIGLLGGALVACIVLLVRLYRKQQELARAVHHMRPGLLLMSSDARIILCNERYRAIYGMSPEIVKPGATLRDVVAHRQALGQFSGNIDEYVTSIRKRIAA